ncbi:MAG TPA: PEGA domain-containing protein [Thermoanaerobaculia bacterium]
MTDLPPETTPPPEPPRERHVPDQPVLPSWVPTVIGIVLVLMAGLAVYTGLRYRNPTLANGIIKTRRPPRAMTGGGPPGEPEPGASLVFPEKAPTAEAASITGSAMMTARRGLITNVLPEDALVYVNGVVIGEARQFNTMNKVYDFAAEGSYTVRLVAPGYKEAQFVITASDNAQQEIARIDAKLARAP